MSICIYCGNPAGFLRKKHKKCEDLFKEGNNKIVLSISSFLKNEKKIDSLVKEINDISYNNYISETNKCKVLRQAVLVEAQNFVNTRNYNLFQLNKYFQLIDEYDFRNEFVDNIVYKNLITFISESISIRMSNEILAINNVKIKDEIENIINSLKFDSSFIEITIIRLLENAIYDALEDNIVTEQEENALLEYIDYFQISMDTLSNNAAYLKLTKSLVIRDILNDKLPHRMNVTNQIPFNLQKGESLIWLINDVDYYEDRTRRQYVGGTQGASIRVARGVYYRTGAFRGQPVDTVEKLYLGKGMLGFTNKHLYFFNYRTSFRIRYDKIISVVPNSDGFTLLKDGATAKPQSFVDGDGWFSYNLISNLSQLDIK